MNELYQILVEADNYGRSNNWPLQETYPQNDKIRNIGGKDAMQAVYYAIRKENFDLADNLNTMWHLVGSWIR